MKLRKELYSSTYEMLQLGEEIIMAGKNYFWGILLILLGVGALVNNILGYNLFSIDRLWPLILIMIGLSFEASYFLSKKAPGVLVPGGILTTIGLLFLFETFTDWRFSAYTWPIFPLAVAIGLFQLYLFGGRNRAVLIPVLILTTISLSAYASMLFGGIFRWLNSSLILPILFIALGILILFRNGKSKL